MSLDTVEGSLNAALDQVANANAQIAGFIAKAAPAAASTQANAGVSSAAASSAMQSATTAAALREELLTAFNSVGLQVPVAYAAGITVDTVTKTVQYAVGGELMTFSPLTTAVPFVTGAQFDPTKWELASNLTQQQADPYFKAGRYPAARAGVSPANADNITQINGALAAASVLGFKEISLPKGRNLISDMPLNPWGIVIKGPGVLVKHVSSAIDPSGTQVEQVNLGVSVDIGGYIHHRAFLNVWYDALIQETRNPTHKMVVVNAGDSTEELGAATPGNLPTQLFKRAAAVAGLQTAYGLEFVNAGHSSMEVEHWRQTYVYQDLDRAPKLYQIRHGVNTPGYMQDMSPAALDSGRDWVNSAGFRRRNAADFLTSLEGGLIICRSRYSAREMAIALYTPCATYDPPNGRDHLYYEEIVAGIIALGLKYGCAVIDYYNYHRDIQGLAGIAQDDIMSPGGRGIHPRDPMNMDLNGLACEAIFPRGLRDAIGVNHLRNIGGAEDVGDGSRTPDWYDFGITISRAINGNGFPDTGFIISFRAVDEMALQFWMPLKNIQRGTMMFRIGASKDFPLAAFKGWGEWCVIGGETVNVEAAPGFTAGLPNTTQGAMRTAQNGSHMRLEGFVAMTDPAPLAQDSLLATVQVGRRIKREAAYDAPTTVYTSAQTKIRTTSTILPDGTITINTAVNQPVSRVYVRDGWSLAD